MTVSFQIPNPIPASLLSTISTGIQNNLLPFIDEYIWPAITHSESETGRNIYLAGAGGIGSNICNAFPKSLNEWAISIFDFDTVEERNLIRQRFTEDNINGNKAEVMARRMRHNLINFNQLQGPYTIGILSTDSAKSRLSYVLNPALLPRFIIHAANHQTSYISWVIDTLDPIQLKTYILYLLQASEEEQHEEVLPCAAGNEQTELANLGAAFHALQMLGSLCVTNLNAYDSQSMVNLHNANLVIGDSTGVIKTYNRDQLNRELYSVLINNTNATT